MLSPGVESATYRFDFLKYRYIWLALSVAYLLIGAAAYVMKGGFAYHIDFTGGAELRVKFEQPVDIGTVRSVVSGGGWKESVIQSIGSSGKDFVMIIGSLSADTEDRIKAAFAHGIQNNPMRVENIQWVGAEAGKDTTTNAILAVLMALVILLLYKIGRAHV